jgi:hypothetical protein
MTTNDDLLAGAPTAQHAGAVVAFKTDSPSSQPGVMFFREVHGRRLTHVARKRVQVRDGSIEMLGDFEPMLERTQGGDWLLRHENRDVTYMSVGDGWANIDSASDDYHLAHTRCREIAEQVRAIDDDPAFTPITFWFLNPARQPQPSLHKVGTPSWEELAGNYGVAAVAGMERLFELEDTPEERMILWHGPTGTGKTHALRALARGWAPWCDVAYITDPETLVGGSPWYLFDVAKFEAGRSAAEAEKRSTLIVLEDSGELMADNARRESGQGLSRLLNLTDGLIGQGLNLMVLITTNEPLTSLHPAVVRPGRLLSQIDFGPLSVEQANDWLGRHNVDAAVDAPTTLAKLYAAESGRVPTRSTLGPRPAVLTAG